MLNVSVLGHWDFGAHNARLYKQDDRIRSRIGGWCAKQKDNNQWLQVDLGKIKFVTAVATQGTEDRKSKFELKSEANHIDLSLDFSARQVVTNTLSMSSHMDWLLVKMDSDGITTKRTDG